MRTSIKKMAVAVIALFLTAPLFVPRSDGHSPINCDGDPSQHFDSVRQYTCSYRAFRDHSIVLADPVKMKEFDRLWNPAILAQAPELKMTGVSDKDREALTFSLISRMRDFTHERFDYVTTPEDLASEQSEDVHPVIKGGIGVGIRLENDWMIDEAIFKAGPADGLSEDDFSAQKSKLSVISPLHRIVIQSVNPMAPADGVLQTGDIVLAVDGTAVDGMLLDDVLAKHIRGKAGKAVKLDILRNNQRKTVSLVRADYAESTVSVEDIDGVRHITVGNFENEHLLRDFNRALTEARALHLKGVDVNLRGNPGGREDYVLAMLEMVVDRGLLLKVREREEKAVSLRETSYTVLDGFGVTIKHKAGDLDDPKLSVEYSRRVPFSQKYEDTARDDPDYVYSNPLLPVIDADMPVVVSVNGDSYSASEIFAGAIQATKRGKIVGQPSAGKGAVMIELALPEGGEVEVTDAQFYPGGLDTKYKGILPDYEVKQADDYGKTDAQKDKAGAVIEEAYERLQSVRDEVKVRVKINSDRFEKEMKERDDDDKKPVKLGDKSAKK